MADRNEQLLLVKKVVRGHAHGHHGGSWKIAYADFATAMMAFFLLMWLLNATTEEQKLGIANFFMPTPYVKNDMVGSSGLRAGQSLDETGRLEAPPRTSPDLVLGMTDGASLAGHDLQAQIERAEEAELERVTARLMQAIEQDPRLAGLAENLLLDRTSEGVRIQIVDRDRRSMFPLGSAVMHEPARRLMGEVATIVAATGRDVSVTGHTDAVPFRTGSVEDNWQLSSDRANASRRALIAAGLPEDRIARVVGRADTEPLDPAQPHAARNRRISIVLLREPRKTPAPAAVEPR